MDENYPKCSICKNIIYRCDLTCMECLKKEHHEFIEINEKLLKKIETEKEFNEDDCEYSIEVYKDYALIKGWISPDILKLLLKLCEKEGFTHLIPSDGSGFKLVKKENG